MADSNSSTESSPDSNRTAPAGAPTSRTEPLVIRSWPKVILMLPILIVALVCGIVMALKPDMPPEEAKSGGIYYVGLAFLIVLAINLLMVLYDLNLRGFLIVTLLIIVLVLAISLLDRKGGAWEKIGKALSVKVFANAAFYFVFSIILLFNLLIAWVITRFNYWKVEHNEIIIHRGFMQEQERHPTAQARFKLVIDDIVEYGILGTGRLVFYFGDDDTEHDLPTVLFVHKKAKRLDDLLGRIEVVSRR